jgi:catechol 2,3-dioxygenase-like lactoylglutathione lyase family enzyme
MFFGISHAEIPVADLDRAKSFWGGEIGLEEARRGDGFVDLDSGSAMLRLIQVGKVEHPVALRVHVGDVQQAYDHLLATGGRALYAPMRTPALELEARVLDADGNTAVVWRELTEDEYDFVPELPKQGQWEPGSEALLKALLSHVPALFRALARRKVTPMVEHLAAEDSSPVTREHVIRGYILSSAKITRYRLVEPLRKEGIDPQQYQAEFDE